MKRMLMLLCAIFLGLQLHAQSYSYSFEGNATPDQLLELESDCNKLAHLLTAKVKYKVEATKGEIIFRTDSPEDRTEKSETFSPIDLKTLLLNRGLTPLELIQLND
jgi:hypothetical protein